MAFEPITTQEQFDAAIKDRMDRVQKSYEEKYSDYEKVKKENTDYSKSLAKANKDIEELNKKVTGFESQIAEKDARIKTYESDSVKTRICLEKGLPIEMASRLTGETEEEISKDADSFTALFKKARPTEPVKEPDSSNKDASYLKLLQGI